MRTPGAVATLVLLASVLSSCPSMVELDTFANDLEAVLGAGIHIPFAPAATRAV
jgi:hypothetical protein